MSLLEIGHLDKRESFGFAGLDILHDARGLDIAMRLEQLLKHLRGYLTGQATHKNVHFLFLVKALSDDDLGEAGRNSSRPTPHAGSPMRAPTPSASAPRPYNMYIVCAQKSPLSPEMCANS